MILSSSTADAIVERLGELQVVLRERSQETEVILKAPPLFPQVNKEDLISNLRQFEAYRAKADETYDFVVNKSGFDSLPGHLSYQLITAAFR